MRVGVVQTGVANMASVRAALRRLGAEPDTLRSGEEVVSAERVLLPGVGTFGAAMDALRSAGLEDALVWRIREGRPTLAICLGMQLMFQASAESPGVDGMMVLPGLARAFPPEVRSPHFGWNHVEGDWLTSGHYYFANSYRILQASSWDVAVCDHGGPFVAAIRKGAVAACQFHPELSGELGHRFLAGWLAGEPGRW